MYGMYLFGRILATQYLLAVWQIPIIYPIPEISNILLFGAKNIQIKLFFSTYLFNKPQIGSLFIKEAVFEDSNATSFERSCLTPCHLQACPVPLPLQTVFWRFGVQYTVFSAVTYIPRMFLVTSQASQTADAEWSSDSERPTCAASDSARDHLSARG